MTPIDTDALLADVDALLDAWTPQPATDAVKRLQHAALAAQLDAMEQ